jgi:hypothetical protein
MLYGFTALAVSVVVGRPGIVLTWRDAWIASACSCA